MSTTTAPSATASMKIGDLARRTGVSPRSLRYYETKRLIVAQRTAGGQRLYPLEAVERVLLIQELFRAGLSSDDVVALLPCVYSGTTTPDMIRLLEQQKNQIQIQVEQLAATRDRLEVVLREARQRLVPASL